MSAKVIFTIAVILLNVITLLVIVTRLKFKSVLNVTILNIPLIPLSDYFNSDVAFWVSFGFLCVTYVSFMLFLRTDLYVDCYVRLRIVSIDDEATLKELDATLSKFERFWYKFWYRRD